MNTGFICLLGVMVILTASFSTATEVKILEGPLSSSTSSVYKMELTAGEWYVSFTAPSPSWNGTITYSCYG